jgi:hypothetical protein
MDSLFWIRARETLLSWWRAFLADERDPAPAVDFFEAAYSGDRYQIQKYLNLGLGPQLSKLLRAEYANPHR